MYDCESGRTVKAEYPAPDSALVRYQGRTHEMRAGVSASGARYIDSGLEWWTRGVGPGSGGMLLRHDPDGPGEVLEQCVQAAGPLDSADAS